MNTDKEQLQLSPNQQQFQPGVMMPPQQPSIIVVQSPGMLTLPFNVANDLNMFSRIFVVREFDKFRIFHFCDKLVADYRVYGELPDGDKKLLFTSNRHFQCCKCCDTCHINFCCCLSYFCCNSIVFQMDYKRNGAPFYTQGLNIQKGCYCCKCYCCYCCPQSILFLRENIDPDSPDFNVGVKKGQTVVVVVVLFVEIKRLQLLLKKDLKDLL